MNISVAVPRASARAAQGAGAMNIALTQINPVIEGFENNLRLA